MRKKPEIRYVDMAKYVDENVHKPDHDIKKIYDYLTMLAYMLAVKRRFFNYEWYYDRFAEYLARITYMRIVKADQPQVVKRKIDGKDVTVELHQGDKCWLYPIKSCLNYMKQVLYVKKCQFVAEEFDYTTDTSNQDLVDAFKDYAYKNVLETNNDLLVCDINLYFKTIDKIIKNEIKSGVYGNDPVMVWKLYTSCLLSLLRNLTPSNKNKIKIDKSVARATYTEELMTDIMYEENKSAPVVYGLSDEYLDYVAYLLQKIKTQIIRDIQELSDEYSLSDEMVEDILMSGLIQSEDE